MDLIKIIANIELDCELKEFYVGNIFIHEDKSIEINFKEDINSI